MPPHLHHILSRVRARHCGTLTRSENSHCPDVHRPNAELTPEEDSALNKNELSHALGTYFFYLYISLINVF